MIDKSLIDILKSGKNKVFLWVFKDNIRACKFYEKCGFKADGTEKISKFDNSVEIRYVRKIHI
jgi:RimJ/RimL family protein N-acetyltransferase